VWQKLRGSISPVGDLFEKSRGTWLACDSGEEARCSTDAATARGADQFLVERSFSLTLAIAGAVVWVILWGLMFVLARGERR